MNAPKSTGRLGWISAVVAIVAVAGTGAIVIKGLIPAQIEVRRLDGELAALKTELEVARQKEKAEQAQVAMLLKHRDSLSVEHSETKEALASAIEEKQEALRELEAARSELSQTLGTQIAAGDVLLTERNGELVVDVADRLLFETGQIEVSQTGQDFLIQVSDSLRRLSRKQVFQVGGHTDSQRVVSAELVERFPTNWELSTARATNVVRFLEERGRISGRQLVAAGYSQFRPAASNKTGTGRRKNRRIEIVLLRKAH